MRTELLTVGRVVVDSIRDWSLNPYNYKTLFKHFTINYFKEFLKKKD